MLDYSTWRLTDHNPLKMLSLLSAERLEEAACDPNFLRTYDSAIDGLRRTHSPAGTWWSERQNGTRGLSIAYFSAEFALHQSVPLYAGGLGVLAADHCKEASDLGVPLVGLGLRYAVGYFQQTISAEGHQLECYDRFPLEETPLQRALMPSGQPCTVCIRLGDANIEIAVWLVRVGRVVLYLLDTDVEQNPEWARELCARLYVGDRDARLQQEIIFGVGGVRALRALGYSPDVWHLNEGHAAFVIFERVRELTEAGQSIEEAVNSVRSTTLFTTHTPVAAGHDTFSFEGVERQLGGLLSSHPALRDVLFTLAACQNAESSLFNMTILALRGSGATNAVSQVHRDVTNSMFTPIVGDNVHPIGAITNGVHVPTWIAPAIDDLFNKYVAPDWKERHDDPTIWDNVVTIPDEELWRVRQLLKAHLLTFIREHARNRWIEHRAGDAQLAARGSLLDPSALTIGFARRFTEYKRSELIFNDHDRLARLLNAPGRPLQLIFAGKAHPADEYGKQSLNRIYQSAADPKFSGRIAFVEDYNMHPAHFFVQGCDVWLNNPRRPLEACGTSGMKASINGVPHLSVADGWWSEGYTGKNGWLIDPGEFHGEEAEAETIYRLLEEQIVPAFYERDARGVPVRWTAIAKQAIRTVAPRFCARRMVKEYVNEMYLALAEASKPTRSRGKEASDS
jgi:starch phosphorylase